MIIFLQALVLIFSPLYVLRFHIYLFPTTVLELLILIAVLFTMVDFFRSRTGLKDLRTSFDFLILFFLLTAFFSVFKSYDLWGGIGIFKAYFLEPVLFFYCLVYMARKSSPKYIIYSLLLSGAWLSILAVLQKLTGQYSLAPYEAAQGRVSAVYNSANSLALFLGPLTILSLAEFITGFKKYHKLFFLSILVLYCGILASTRSRGGLLSEIGALIIMVYANFSLKIKLIKKFWYVAPILVTLVIGLLFYQVYQNYNFVPHLANRPYTQGDTLQIRFFLWSGTANLLKDNPIFGAGLNGFKTLYTNQYRLPQYQEEFQYPHNLLLTFWAETGLLGLFAFLLLLTSCFSLIIRNLANHPKPILGIALLTIFSYWVLHGMVDVPYFKNDLSVEFWAVVALLQLWVERA